MKSLPLILALLCLAVSATAKLQSPEPCPKNCMLIYEPVCASRVLDNGTLEFRRFPNKCIVDNQNCMFKRKWIPVPNVHCKGLPPGAEWQRQ